MILSHFPNVRHTVITDNGCYVLAMIVFLKKM